MPGKRPNILFFCVDEMRADHLACMGNPMVKTPNLDRLAAGGTLFRRAYCNNPICMPARATMFTGLLPRDHGLRVNGQSLRQDIPVLPQLFKAAGYRTHAAGKLHLTPWVPKEDRPRPEHFPESMAHWKEGRLNTFPVPYYGFDRVDFVGGHTSYAYGDYPAWLREQGGDPAQLGPDQALEPPTGAPLTYKMRLPVEWHYNRFISDRTIETIHESARDGQPFFAWCSFPDPHMPVAPPAPYCHQYSPDDVALPAAREGEADVLPPVYRQVLSGDLKPNGVDNRGVTEAHKREIIAGTYGMITHLDMEIGRVLDALEASGQAGNTIVVFTSDHGDMMGDHGLLWKSFYTFRGCVQIPLIIAVPGGVKGQVTETLACQLDALPTLLGLASLPMPDDGWALRPTPFERGSVQPLQSYPGCNLAALLRGQVVTSKREDVVIENDDPTTGFRVRALVTDRYRLTVYPGTSHGELFDLQEDPDELWNLWGRPDCRELRQSLTGRLLERYAQETPLFPIPPWNS